MTGLKTQINLHIHDWVLGKISAVIMYTFCESNSIHACRFWKSPVNTRIVFTSCHRVMSGPGCILCRLHQRSVVLA